MDLHIHLLAFDLASSGGHGVLPYHRFSDSMVHCHSHGAQPFYLVVPYYDSLLGEPVDPHNLDEISDP